MENLINTLDIVSLIAGISSLILAVVAIFLAFHQKSEADKVNENTRSLLIEIKTDAKVISQIAMPELKAYGKSMRDLVFRQVEGPNNNALHAGGKQFVNDDILSTLDKLKKESDSDKIHGKLEELEERIKESNKKTEEFEISSNDLVIDVTELNKGFQSVRFNKYHKFQLLIDILFSEFLKGRVPPNSYGSKWNIVESGENKVIKALGELDSRTLLDVGVSTNNVYKIVLG